MSGMSYKEVQQHYTEAMQYGGPEATGRLWVADRLAEAARDAVLAEGIAAKYPEVKVTLSTCAVEWEFDDVHADVGLVYCEIPPNPKYHWVPLFEYSLFPVCSPEVAARMGTTPTAADLLAQPLVAIYTEVRNWKSWFESAGVPFDPASPYLVVDTLAVALEMALAGQAIALVNGPFVDADLASGRLVRPVPHKTVCPGEWGLICRKDMKDNLRIRKFIDWTSAHVGVSD